MPSNPDHETRETYRIPLDGQDAQEVARFEADNIESQTMRITSEGISILMAKPPTSPLPRSADETFEDKFARLASEWRKETRYISSLSKIAMNPNYQKIIGMGDRAVPLILSELKDRGGHWLWALHAITGEDPAPENATFAEAKQAWLKWATEIHLIK